MSTNFLHCPLHTSAVSAPTSPLAFCTWLSGDTTWSYPSSSTSELVWTVFLSSRGRIPPIRPSIRLLATLHNEPHHCQWFFRCKHIPTLICTFRIDSFMDAPLNYHKPAADSASLCFRSVHTSLPWSQCSPSFIQFSSHTFI